MEYVKTYVVKDRIKYIDLFRSIGIILMMMGHIEFGEKFDHFIHAFHMPMFFLLTGMFFDLKKEMVFLTYVKKKVKTLLLPYVIFGVFHYCIWLIINRSNMSLEPIKALLFINTDNLPIAGALWFLTSLFFSEIIYYIIKCYIKKKEIQNILIVVMALCGCIGGRCLPFRLPYAIDTSLVGVGLIHIGNLLANNKNNKVVWRFFNLKHYECLIVGIFTSMLIFTNGYINMRTGSYGLIILFWLNTILSFVVGINLSKYMQNMMPEKVITFLTSIGRNSIVYVCLNQLVIKCACGLARMIDVPTMVSKCVILCISIITIYIATYVIMNTKLKWIIGKNV